MTGPAPSGPSLGATPAEPVRAEPVRAENVEAGRAASDAITGTVASAAAPAAAAPTAAAPTAAARAAAAAASVPADLAAGTPVGAAAPQVPGGPPAVGPAVLGPRPAALHEPAVAGASTLGSVGPATLGTALLDRPAGTAEEAAAGSVGSVWSSGAPSWTTSRTDTGWTDGTDRTDDRTDGTDRTEAAPLGDPRISATGERPVGGSDGGRRGGWLRPALAGGLVGALVASLTTGGLLLALQDDDSPATTTATASAARPATAERDPIVQGAASSGASSADIRGAYETIRPSIVSIQTRGFDQRSVFGVEPSQGAGSGIIISDDGYVLTNNHVVAGATSIRVTLSNRETKTASLVGGDPDNDIAVIRIDDAKGLPAAKLGDSSKLQVGEPVVAIGNALALPGGPTVTSGIVLGARPHHRGLQRAPHGPHPDRRGDQPGQLRRRARQRGR